MGPKGYLGLMALVAASAACSSTNTAKADEAGQDAISAAEFAANPKLFDDQEVSVRGYLGVYGRDLVIYPNESEAEKLSVWEDAVFVYDSSPDRFLGFEEVDSRINCTSHYVELIGVGGLLPGSIYGILEIKSIYRFENSGYAGAGERCYP